MIDYQAIVEELDDTKVKQLLDSLNIPYEDRGSYILMPTVCHNADADSASWKLYYYKNSHIFQCYTECGSQTIFTFLKNYYTIRDIVYDWYEDILQVILNCSNVQSRASNPNQYKSIHDNYAPQKERRQLPSFPEGVLDVFIKYYPVEWLNDGISKAAMDKYNIRFSPTQNKIIIPHYDAAGRLVGIRGRALNTWEIENFGKYMPVQIENKWYSHPLSLNLYGLNLNKENIKRTGIAYLFEAEKSVLQFESFDMLNCAVAVCGSKLNKYALDILVRECHPREIVICFDQEEEPKSSNYFNKLYAICQKYSAYASFSFIYDKQHLLNLKDSPSDHGEQIFKRLLETRVRV
jgi:hypothetical protein